MKKMKTRTKVLLLILGLIILAIVISPIWGLPKYEFSDSGYAIGSTINIDGVIYEEVNKDMYEEIYDELNKQGIGQYEYEVFGRIDYILGYNTWKYKIYGSKNVEDRILLKGKEDYAVNDANYPEIYFCRQDVLHSPGDIDAE